MLYCDEGKLKEHGGNIEQLAKRLGFEHGQLIDFSSNINPFGPSEKVIAAIRQSIERVADYPEQRAESFVEAVAQMIGVKEENVVAGNGTIELLYLIPQVFKVKSALLVVPSFTEYELALRNAKSNIKRRVALTSKKAVGIIKKGLKGIDIAIMGNPNNPCGYIFEKEELIRIIDENPGCLFVIDEAFIDFLRDKAAVSLVKEAANRDNLIVLRSLTKIYSIAGLRIGYMVASSTNAKRVSEAKYPWSVNSVALAAGLSALKDERFVNDSVSVIEEEAKRLYNEISKIKGLMAYKPSANYIMVKLENGITAAQLQKEMLKYGIVIRDCSTFIGLNDYYFRIAVKKPQQNNKMLNALKDVLSE
ncbi:MAG: threonine-phosphate decarboxylase CobD [Actinomycetota bacterium]|nr:threonine-phosphate decarboxylase CobD [Actinomycetota bacterium]